MELQRFSSEKDKESFGDVAKLISYAIHQAPVDIMQKVAELNATPMDATFQGIADSIAGVIHESFIEHTGEHSVAGVSFLGPAINDTARIVRVITAQYPDVSDEAVTNIMTHPDTIDTVALLALRPEEDMLPYIQHTLHKTGSLSSNGAYTIKDKRGLSLEEYKGCPAAGFLATYEQTGRVAPLHIFKQLVPWATKLYLLSDGWQESREAQHTARARKIGSSLL